MVSALTSLETHHPFYRTALIIFEIHCQEHRFNQKTNINYTRKFTKPEVTFYIHNFIFVRNILFFERTLSKIIMDYYQIILIVIINIYL